jgi:hypothetical protein
MKSGVIKLLSWEGEPIAKHKYDGVPERNRILDQWKRLYGQRFSYCYLQITPNVAVVNECSRKGFDPKGAYGELKRRRDIKKLIQIRDGGG